MISGNEKTKDSGIAVVLKCCVAMKTVVSHLMWNGNLELELKYLVLPTELLVKASNTELFH